MRAGRCLVGILATATLAAPPLACADVYRWVDEKGVINLSNIPPKNAKIVQRFESPVNPAPAVQRDPPVRSREAELEARIERLERELEEARRASAMSVPAPPPVYEPVYYYPPVPAYVTYGYPVVVGGIGFNGLPAGVFKGFPAGSRSIVRPVPLPAHHGAIPMRPHGVRPAPIGAVRGR